MKNLYLSITFGLLISLSGGLSAQAATVETHSLSHSTLPRNAVNVPFLEIHISTDQNPLWIDAITVKRTGLSSNDDIQSVRIQGNRTRSFQASVGNDDLARVRFFRGYYIPPNTQETLVVSASLEAQGANRTIGFELVNIENQGRTYTNRQTQSRYDTYRAPRSSRYSPTSTTTRTSSYEIPSIEFKPLGGGGTINVGSNSRIGRFQLKNPSRKVINLNHLTLRNRGTADLQDMFYVLELRDNNGWTISRSTQISDDYVTFSLDNYPIEGGDNLNLSVWGQAQYGKHNRTVELVLDERDDLSGTYGRTRYPTTARSRQTTRGRTYRRSSQNYVSRSSNTRTRGLWNRNYNPGANQITFMAERLSFKAPVYLDRVRTVISPSSRVTDHNGNGFADLEDYETAFENFRLFLNGQYIDQTDRIESSGGKLYLEFSLGETLSGSNELRVVGDVSREAQSGDRLKIQIDRQFSFPEWEYVR